MITFSRSIFYILMFIFISGFSTGLIAQEIPEYNLENVVVTAGRITISFSDLARNVIVISNKEIELMPVVSVQDILQYITGVDLKQRGLQGTQSDAGIRGGSFEQTLILIDGVKFSDPQTGHHNMNIPLSADQVERIEILKGQGSRIFGPNAFSGAINFITKKTRQNSLGASVSGGSYSSYDMNINGAFSAGINSNRLSITRKKSDGYIHNTNYLMTNLSYSGSLNIGSNVINAYYGYSDQEFGANSFYSLRYPNQWENVKTNFASLVGEFGNQSFSLSTKIFWRKKNDEFLLDYSRPDFYKNLHETNSFGFETQATLDFSLGKLSFGGEYSRDMIESTNLGNHSRENKGMFIEQNVSAINNLFISVGAYFYNYSSLGWKLWSGLDASYTFLPGIKIKGSVGKAFRTPSYTDLYYNDPVTAGNSDLNSEESINHELTVEFNNSTILFSLTGFLKEGKNIIDWIRTSSEGKWQAENITEINTSGLEVHLEILTPDFLSLPLIENISLNYAYLSSDKSSLGYESRYLLDYLKHQIISTLNLDTGYGIKSVLNFRYEDRIYSEKHFLVDVAVSKNFVNGQLFLKVTNLFDRRFHDIAGVVLPGRWITGGIKYAINDL